MNIVLKNKAGNYFRYALGEIVLVVIGILIALQINTWNETRKAKQFERIMLHEIYLNLKDDIVTFKMLDQRVTAGDQAIKQIIKLLASDQAVQLEQATQQKLDQLLSDSTVAYLFSYNRGAFDALKSSGIEKVQNDELRSRLVFHYDYSLPRVKELIQITNNEITRQADTELAWRLFNYKIKDDGEGNLGVYMDSYKGDDYKSQQLLRFIKRHQNRIGHFRFRLSRILPNAEALLQELEQVLAQELEINN